MMYTRDVFGFHVEVESRRRVPPSLRKGYIGSCELWDASGMRYGYIRFMPKVSPCWREWCTAGCVQTFFDENNITVLDMMKQLEAIADPAMFCCDNNPPATAWTFLIRNRKTETLKVVDHNFVFLDIPERFFSDSKFIIVIAMSAQRVQVSTNIEDGMICNQDTSYFNTE